MNAPQTSSQSGFAFIWRALRYRNYRLFFAGQIVSLMGTWITATASSWLVYRLTGSAFLLGVVGFSGQIPSFLLAPLAGVYVDRWNRHRLLVITQALSMLQSAALAWLTLSHRVTIEWIIALNIFQGVVNAFDMPCRQSFVVSMIEKKEDLGNAIALNSSMFNVARLLGPMAAGGIIAVSNEGWCFAIDTVSYVAVIIALLAMRIPPEESKRGSTASVVTQLKEGWSYVSTFRPIRSVILLLALTSLVGVPYAVLIPVFAVKVLHGGPHTLGFLMTASGCGALLGALWLATRPSVRGLGRVIPMAAALFALGIGAFSMSRSIVLSLIILVFAGFGFMVHMASSNTIVQTIVDDNMRGRVMAFFNMAFLGTVPFGSLLAGSLSDRIGPTPTILIGSVLCLAAAGWFARQLPEIRVLLRGIYEKKGIPPIAAAVQDATALSVRPDN